MTPSRTHEEISLHRRFVPARGPSRFLLGVIAAMGAIVLLGIFVAPGRVWPNVLVAAIYFIGLSLAGLLFLAIHYVTKAGWSVSVKRVAEAVASTLPAAAGLILLMLCGMGVLYEWTHEAAVAADPLLEGKSAWLNTPFFIGRAFVFLAVWMVFGRALLRSSRRQDETGGLASNRTCTALSACFLVAFAITFSLASFDWLMSLQPIWYSTIFAVYNIAG